MTILPIILIKISKISRHRTQSLATTSGSPILRVSMTQVCSQFWKHFLQTAVICHFHQSVFLAKEIFRTVTNGWDKPQSVFLARRQQHSRIRPTMLPPCTRTRTSAYHVNVGHVTWHSGMRNDVVPVCSFHSSTASLHMGHFLFLCSQRSMHSAQYVCWHRLILRTGVSAPA
jgi:hypothetical protein